MTEVKTRTTNARGILCGESQPMCRYPDTLVATARRLRAEGHTLRAIAEALGPRFQTIHLWLTGRRRKPAARIVVTRIKPK